MQLPGLYREIINHPNTSDELRRETEAKLLEHRWRLLLALPASAEFLEQKTSLIQEVDDMVNGMVLLGVRNELAWTIFIEGKDAETIGKTLSPPDRIAANIHLQRTTITRLSHSSSACFLTPSWPNYLPRI